MVEVLLIAQQQPDWGPLTWVIFPVERFEQLKISPSIDEEDLKEMAARSPLRSVSLIHLGAIVATVDALFAEKGEA